ncbi:MAG: ABC transporter permease [bacterium]
MIKLIIEKELREIIGSTKFAVTFGVCSLLILLTFYASAQNHQVNLQKYRAAKAENFRQLQGLTDWLRVNNYRIFLPPQPLESLVIGISNDIGRTIEMAGRGELSAHDSRFNNDPIFALFRFLDLDFLIQIVFSLFAILFAYDAINGEKERGTLRLTFANAMARDKYILGKLIGSFLALVAPLLIPILLGMLILPMMGLHLTGEEWLRLLFIVLTGLLYFGVFLTLSIFISAMTTRSSNSFLLLLVIWIFAVLIIPRTSVLIAGRAVEVPSVDELASQKNRLRSQLWNEDRKKMATFKPGKTSDFEAMHQEFQKFMEKLAEERNKKMLELTDRLNEDRRNRQIQQERLAFSLAKMSPTSAFSLATTKLTGVSIELKNHFLKEAVAYQKEYGEFMKEKTGMNPGGGMIIMHLKQDDEEEEKPIDPKEMPEFKYHQIPLTNSLNAALFDIGLLGFFNVLFFAGAFVKFLRYDVR